jgi:branched-chain amino acid aminotransferase
MDGEGCVFINGKYCSPEQAHISVFDIGFTHSDVVYDVVSVCDDIFFRLDDHIDRFLSSCEGVRLDCPYNEEEIEEILANCVSRGGVGDNAYVAMVLTRGRYTKEGEQNRNIFKTVPTFIAYAVPYVRIASLAKQKIGLHIVVSKTPRIPSECVDARYKNYHWGDLTRGLMEAHDAGADNAVLCSLDGYLSEGPGFNLFFVSDGCIYTPENNVLMGITRQTVIDLAVELDVPLEVGSYRSESLLKADEAFICSTAGGIMPVARVDGRELGNGHPGRLTSALREMYWNKRKQGWMGTSVVSLCSIPPKVS